MIKKNSFNYMSELHDVHWKSKRLWIRDPDDTPRTAYEFLSLTRSATTQHCIFFNKALQNWFETNLPRTDVKLSLIKEPLIVLKLSKVWEHIFLFQHRYWSPPQCNVNISFFTRICSRELGGRTEIFKLWLTAEWVILLLLLVVSISISIQLER